MTTSTWLLATLGLTAALWIPYVLDRFAKIGITRTVGNPSPTDLAALSPWARRAYGAHANAVENLAVFAPLALLAIHAGVADGALATAASAAYFWARLGYYVVYAAGVSWLRTLAFLVGFGAQIALVVAIATGGPS
jgi:uncharacterized MAPEG superfamily protein